MKGKTVNLSKEDTNAFTAALKNGIGLTKACQLIQVTPKVMSEYLLKNKKYHAECLEAMKYSAKVLLVMASEQLTKRNYGAWQGMQGHINGFVTELNFWESWCKKEQVTVENIFNCFNVLNDLDEVSTAMGMTRKELMVFLGANPALKFALMSKK